MIEVSECVACNSAIHRVHRALVAPFLALRIWNRKPFHVDLVECTGCGFFFHNPRLDNADLRSLYADYRLAEYQQMRHASEPWYTPKFNEDLASPSLYERRRAALASLLQQHLEGRTIRRVLDYGGDRGDLVAGLIHGAEAYVYDISGIPAAAGVTAVGDPASCRPDLIINSNVLEHVGFPRELVRSILDAAGDGLVYLEVPAEQPTGVRRIMRRIAQIGVMSLAHPSLATSILRPASLYMMHEHINYFTKHALTTLFRAAGGTVHASGVYTVEVKPTRAEFAWCLGTKSGSQA
jgi:Zn ribbon nucleic-acid-binding protein